MINGRKWWSTGAGDRRCAVAIVMGVSDPDGPRHARHSMVLVPFDAPGVTVERHLTVFGYDDQAGHPVVSYEDVRVPKDHLLGVQGAGFAVAQKEIAAIKVVAARMACRVLDRAIQAFGGAGVSGDFPPASRYSSARMMRLVDGPFP